MSTKINAKKVWLEEGLKILETEGPGMLSIENLTRRTGKTKGSFYHHFRDRNGYVEKLLEYYEAYTTREIIERANEENDPQGSLRNLTKLTFRLSGTLELAIRAWALYDSKVRRFQDRMDLLRSEYLRELHQAAGLTPAKARNAAYRDYALFLGLQQLRHNFDEKRFAEILRALFHPSQKPDKASGNRSNND